MDVVCLDMCVDMDYPLHASHLRRDDDRGVFVIFEVVVECRQLMHGPSAGSRCTRISPNVPTAECTEGDCRRFSLTCVAPSLVKYFPTLPSDPPPDPSEFAAEMLRSFRTEKKKELTGQDLLRQPQMKKRQLTGSDLLRLPQMKKKGNLPTQI